MKIKNLFSTPLKAIRTVVLGVGVLSLVCVGTANAASTVAENNAIGSDSALYFACIDAGIDPTDVQTVSNEFSFEQGQFVYDVEFTTDQASYDYWVKASDGSIVQKQVEVLTTTVISLDDAKAVALLDAQATNVTYTKAELDVDELKYEIEFVDESFEYDYDIDAVAGTILEKSKEALPTTSATTDNTTTTTDNNNTTTNETTTDSSLTTTTAYIGVDKAKSIALSDAGVSDVTFQKAELDFDDGIVVYDVEFVTSTTEYEYEINATTGAIVEKSSEAIKTTTNNSTTNNSTTSSSNNSSSTATSTLIGLEKAKSIALSDAGVSSVTYQKAELDYDDGVAVYDIEFVTSTTE